MGQQIISLQPIRDSAEAFIKLIDAVFPTPDVRITVREGGFTNDQPWNILVSVGGEFGRRHFRRPCTVDIRLKPQQFTDWILNDGGHTPEGYACDMFVSLMQEWSDEAIDPRWPMAEAKRVFSASKAKTFLTEGGSHVGAK